MPTVDETSGGPARDRGFKARKREDHALQLIERLKESLDDLTEVRSILRELGRYYDPVLGGAIMEVAHQRAIVEARSEEHTSELQSQSNLVCRLLLEKKKKTSQHTINLLTAGASRRQ